MTLDSLEPFFTKNEGEKLTPDELEEIYNNFKATFVDKDFIFEGLKVKINILPAKPKEYSKFNDTFYHLITRDHSVAGMRVFEIHRANRIHWINCILENSKDESIKYYKAKIKEKCREHFWLFKKDFMVVLEPATDGTQIISAFIVDKNKRMKFMEDKSNFDEGKSDC